ncbi:hypothetical protein [Solibacillus sp. NPDC093137]|uniref:hypothetical protein n=1 Tax=Solibacillus sp. NPDC093137 TaxID=3390678 RepID=UPI003D03D841
MTVQIVEKKQDKDGGYYAIKGFIYQFDLTLKEIISNPGTPINFENQQDIDYENYVIQVKHKETANFSLSKVKSAIIQLFQLSLLDSEKKFKLYSHFKDKDPGDTQRLSERITMDQLDKILGENPYNLDDKDRFIKNFEIVFLHNFDETFNQLINLIKQKYGLANTEIALYYHAMFQTELTQLAIKTRTSRTISSYDLDSIIENNNKVIFYEGYRLYMSEDKYIKLLRDQYFTHRKPHIVPHERIFIIECGPNELKENLIDIVYKISDKFYRDGVQTSKTPAPFICFRNLSENNLIDLKITLLDNNFYFNDGTFFYGDKLRVETLLSDRGKEYKVRLIDENLLKILEGLKSVETYQFFKSTPIEVDYKSKNIKLSINSLENVLKIIS